MKKWILGAALVAAPLLMAASFTGLGDWTKISAPGNPASTALRMWADSSAGKFLCKTSAGAACYFDANPATACTSCVTSSSPGAGIAHFAGSTQAVTSSAVSLTADVSGTLPVANGGTGQTSGTVTFTIASGTSALGTSAISSAACATVVSTTATGTATTDNLMADFNADPTAVTGYAPSASGMLTIVKYPTADHVNFKACNLTGSSITPGAITLNWRVVR